MMKDAKRVGVYGASGSGKSTLVKVLLAGRPRVVAFDPLGEYAGAGWRQVKTFAAVLAAIQAGWGRGFRVAFIPPAGAEPDALHRLARLLLAVQRPYFQGQDARKVSLVVEEMNLAFPVAALPRDLSGFPELCSRGRHSGVEILGVTQRLSEVATRFRGNTDEAYFLRQGDHTDVAAATKILGPAYRGKLLSLARGQVLHFRAGCVTEGTNKRPPM